jgi:hypothetical protein
MSKTKGEDLAEMKLWSVVQLSRHLPFGLKVQGLIARGKFSRTFLGPGPLDLLVPVKGPSSVVAAE